MADTLEGHTSDGLRFDVLLGRGAMGAVYAGEQTMLGRKVAIKVDAPHLASDENFTRRFTREAKLVAQVNHPNVMACYGFGPIAGPNGDLLVMILEYVDGPTLAELSKGKPISLRAVFSIIAKAAQGLAAAHDQGIVHRDLKPANILTTMDGTVKLADFGLACSESSDELTHASGLMGTPAYMAPELAKGGEPSPQSDCYSLGCTLYRILMGNNVYRASTPWAVLQAHVDQPIPSVAASYPEWAELLDGFLATALAKDPDKRFVDAKTFASAVGDLAQKVPAAAVVCHEPVERSAVVRKPLAVVAGSVPAAKVKAGTKPAAKVKAGTKPAVKVKAVAKPAAKVKAVAKSTAKVKVVAKSTAKAVTAKPVANAKQVAVRGTMAAGARTRSGAVRSRATGTPHQRWPLVVGALAVVMVVAVLLARGGGGHTSQSLGALAGSSHVGADLAERSASRTVGPRSQVGVKRTLPVVATRSVASTRQRISAAVREAERVPVRDRVWSIRSAAA
ncbi:MAG: protein kinase domain-containing protein [Planctomycetota bacterium]